MKYLIPAILIVLCLASVGLGREWQPFVGISGLVEQPNPFRYLNYPDSRACVWLPIAMSFGTEFEAGFRLRQSEWYAAYHMTNSNESLARSKSTITTNYETQIRTYIYRHTSWAERRGIIGYRYRVPTRSRVAPLVGGGVSLGRSSYRQRDQEHVYRNEDTLRFRDVSHKHNGSLSSGILLELGVDVPIVKALAFATSTQIQLFSTKGRLDDDYDFKEERYVVVMPTLLLQLRYVFR